MKTLKLLVIWPLCVAISHSAGADTLAQQEANWLKEFRRTQEPTALAHLAMVREERGLWSEAASTWQWLDKRWGSRVISSQSRSPAATWHQVVDFHLHRIARKRNLGAKPPRVTPQLRRRLADAAIQFGNRPPVDQLDFVAQADLDGDSVDEIVFLGRSGPLGKRTRKMLGIARWNGTGYRVVWKTTQPIPFMMHVVDRDADGWKEVFLGYTPDSDDVATLYFNGQSALLW
ncbi:MAG: hypothetical protein KY445_11415 [Armatimonadetes bacterium]|nr:hypothetical protein [Armatimonadota bacterium]